MIILSACCSVFRVSFAERQGSEAGVNGNEVPPVPIPNTEVKLIRVDNTWMETSREDRSMPAPKARDALSGFSCIYGPLAQLVRAPGS